MSDYSVTINARGCDKTGITEELIASLYNGGRNEVLAMVTLKPVKEHLDRNTGKKRLDLVILEIEPVVAKNGKVETQLDEHLRIIKSALHYERGLLENGGDQLPFGEEDGPAPRVADILQQGKGLVDTEHGGIFDPDREPVDA